MFVFSTVSLGDKPAAALLEIAVKKVAELNSNIDPVAANRIINDRYVDDFASGGSPVESPALLERSMKTSSVMEHFLP